MGRASGRTASVLLVNPPTLSYVAAQGLEGQFSYWELECRATETYWIRSFPGEHLGLMSLLASLRAHGIDAISVNGQTLNHRSVAETWQAMEKTAVQEAPKVIGFSGPCQVFLENLELARLSRVKWPDALIVLGHDFATLNHARILSEYEEFDGIVLGEGERSIVEIARAVAAGHSPHDVAGTAWRDVDGRVTVSPRPIEPLDLDVLPEVARDELKDVLGLGLSACIFTTRGCPYRCTYCTTGQVAGLLHKKFGYRERSIVAVVDEIERLVRDFEIPHLTIVDDLFLTRTAASQERARAFAQELRARGVRVPFMFDCRLDSVDMETFRELVSSGLHRVFIGIETGSADQLSFYNKRYGKPYDVEYARRRIDGLRDLGIDVLPGILTFHPATSARELRETLNLIDACGYDTTWNLIRNVFAYPGTILWRQFKQAGWLTVEWPVPRWEFADSRAKNIKETVFQTVADGGDYATARAVFERLLCQWEAESAASEEMVTRADTVYEHLASA